MTVTVSTSGGTSRRPQFNPHLLKESILNQKLQILLSYVIVARFVSMFQFSLRVSVPASSLTAQTITTPTPSGSLYSSWSSNPLVTSQMLSQTYSWHDHYPNLMQAIVFYIQPYQWLSLEGGLVNFLVKGTQGNPLWLEC